jgi:hypothetical protein
MDRGNKGAEMFGGSWKKLKGMELIYRKIVRLPFFLSEEKFT